MQGNAQVVAGNLVPHSLVWATDIDVLPADRVVLRRDGYWAIRSPANPGHYWGNLLIYDHAPQPGDRDRWLATFATELPGLEHRTLAWDVTDGSLGAAGSEFSDFNLEPTVGLVAEPSALVAHARANSHVRTRTLDPDGDEAVWDEIVALWERQRHEDKLVPPNYRAFAVSRLAELREHFRRGRGAWFVALDGDLVVGSLGVVVTDGRARYQSVDTRLSHRRHGVASRLVVEAARHVTEHFGVASLVIAAEPDYHALGMYESLGFRRVEQVSGVCRWPNRIEP